MDQAASILGRRDHALFIEFDPIRVRAVRMPSHAAMVVADSREVADKSGQVRAEYNRRVIECALAARILARALELDGVKIIGDVVRRLRSWDADDLTAALAASAPASLSGLDSAARILGIEEQALRAELLGGGPNKWRSTRPGRWRSSGARVTCLSETKRVERAAAALEAGKLDEVGALMNAVASQPRRQTSRSARRGSTRWSNVRAAPVRSARGSPAPASADRSSRCAPHPRLPA